MHVAGARLFEVDTSNQILLISRRHAGIGGKDVLTKVNFLDLDIVLLLLRYIFLQELFLNVLFIFIFLYGFADELDTSI